MFGMEISTEQLRLMTTDDLAAATEISTAAGWNQTLEDWQMLMALEPHSCLAIEADGQLVSTTTLLCYSRRLAWIGMVLTNAIHVELAFDLGRFGNVNARLVLPGLRGQFFVEDLLAKNDAVVADINAGAGDELFDLRVGFAAKTAEGDIGGPRHRVYSFLSAKLVARSTSPGISLRD